MTEPLTREEALRMLPNLRGVNLYKADLHGANLRGANLSRAYLCRADLRGTNLRWADLRDANLYGADLRGADLYGANLRGADLRWADLRDADLHGANLRGANLASAKWDGLAVDGLHRYRCLLIPTRDGWVVLIGCWSGTVDALQQMIHGDDWPESDAEQRTHLRPRLQAWIDMCRLHIEQHPRTIADLTERWGSDE